MPQVAVDYTKESRPYGIGNRSTNLTSGTSNQINKTGITSGVGQRVQTTPKTTTPTYTPTPTSSGSSSGGGGYSGGGGGGSVDYESSILDQIKSLLKEQEELSSKYYDTLYTQRMNEINTESENNRDLINKRYKQGERYLNDMYGKTDSGTNWTNRARNQQNWQSMLAQNRQNTAGLKDSAMASRDLGKANAKSTLAQGWYNYILPVMTNRQNYNDSLAQELEYRKYLANL